MLWQLRYGDRAKVDGAEGFRVSDQDPPPGNEDTTERFAATVVQLADAGPFLFPPCFRVELGVGEDMALLELITNKGQKLLIPLNLDAVAELYDLSGQCLVAMGRAAGPTQ
jgi:hypothetical protein